MPGEPLPAAAPASGLPPPSQFVSSLWGTNQWEESEWKPAASGLSAAIAEPPAPSAKQHDSRPPPKLDSKPPPGATIEPAVGGEVIASYSVMKPLGDASDGLILARAGERVVSLKALTLPDVDDARLLQAFVARARSAARLEDPHLLQVRDFIEHAGRWYAVTDPVFGESLRSRARRTPLTIAAAVKVIEDAARALTVLRRARRAHGAVTNRGLFLVEREQVADHLMLLDFGAGSGQDVLVANEALAPERKAGGEPDARGDVWGLGSVLFELLEGRPLAQARELSPLSRSREPIPPLLAELVTRALSPDPRARFSSVESMAAALPHALGLAPRPMPSKSSSPALQGVSSSALPPVPEAAPAPAAPGRRARPRWVMPALAALGLLGLLLVGIAGHGLVQDGEPPPVEPVPVESAPPEVTPALAAVPEIHPMLLSSAANKLVGGAARDAAPAPPPKAKPAVKKPPAKKKKR